MEFIYISAFPSLLPSPLLSLPFLPFRFLLLFIPSLITSPILLLVSFPILFLSRMMKKKKKRDEEVGREVRDQSGVGYGPL